ncbi:glycerol kinase GlpK [Parasegetibacter sp. NRK P23]|uniref:glycerol kinase GlpK n=1 Tax=Parasegetibacter sp. NRK P23 TaxID=2942999 RepID=UPI00204411BD|nr:glycerol kinase GlpK [Parasegetibacter sp. NRK P23]MCM5527612.1 glycerol kinase GlpK [Parasegetibacter sp. NRK P23]
MEKFILALDQGTTSSRAIVFNGKGAVVAVAQKEFKQHYPQPGWVEHDPMEIWSTQAGVTAEAVVKAGITGAQIAAMGITNQRETTVVWNKETGKPVYNAIVWQDRRTAAFCDELKAQGRTKTINEKTGLLPDAYFSGTKIRWILNNVEGARELANQGKLLFGNIDSWLIWNFTKGAVHVTDVTNASRTMLYNIATLQWDEELLRMLDIPASMLPEVKSSSEVYGETHASIFNFKVPIAGIAGDQQAALFGQMCLEPGMVKNTYGTGCFMVMNTGDKIIPSSNNLLSTIAWQLNGKTTYALEGSIFIAGAVVQWLRDGLGIIRNAAEIEALATSVSDNEGVYVVPAFAGLGAPHWNQDARGCIFGATRGTTSAHLARAALESIAYQTRDVLKAMEADSGINIKALRVDGGATANNLLMQFQCDVLGVEVVRPKVVETTALGAAFLAGLATGFWDSVDTIRELWEEAAHFRPQMPEEKVNKYVSGWNRAVKAAIAWADNHESNA